MSCQALLVGQDFGIWPWHDGVIASSGGVLLLQASRRMAVLQHVQRIQTPGRASCDPSPAHVAWQRQIQAYCKSWLHAFLHPSILGAKWGWTSGRRVHAVMMLSSPLFDGWLYAGFFHSRSLTLSFSFCFLFILEKMINIFAVSWCFSILANFLQILLLLKKILAFKWGKENKDLEISSVRFGIFFPLPHLDSFANAVFLLDSFQSSKVQVYSS